VEFKRKKKFQLRQNNNNLEAKAVVNISK
jgi:hypothetical protein